MVYVSIHWHLRVNMISVGDCCCMMMNVGVRKRCYLIINIVLLNVVFVNDGLIEPWLHLSNGTVGQGYTITCVIPL